jgi:hypothetical protein
MISGTRSEMFGLQVAMRLMVLGIDSGNVSGTISIWKGVRLG